LKRGTTNLYSITLTGILNTYEYEELVKVFLKPQQYQIVVNDGIPLEKNEQKRQIYNYLANITNKRPEWGILTGVRPVKLAGELYKKLNELSLVKKVLEDEYFLSSEKADLLVNIFAYQQSILSMPTDGQVGVYIGIPFCPTRCLYCSFTSNQASDEKIALYMSALYKEIEFVSHEMKRANTKPESIYIGGGTPTILDAVSLKELLLHVRNNFDFSELKEFTVEAGRPDTITASKLKIMEDAGVSRISINPQSMQEKTLQAIGRLHTSKEIEDTVNSAREEGSYVINMDIIAGLPEENANDFVDTLEKVIALSPENITVHTLAVKRASKLIDIDKEYHYKQSETVTEMLKLGNERLTRAGYVPYYLYRQKHMAGNLENIGWCKDKTAGIYNIRIMQEAQTIIALGAGGISKMYYPDENRLERVPNVTNYEIYISQIDEMIRRKAVAFAEQAVITNL